MKNKTGWKVLLVLGLCPLAAPFLLGVYNIASHSWSGTLADWLILYSFVYWPTYAVGLALAGLSLYKLKKRT